MPADGGITESQLHDSSWFFIKFSLQACWAEKSGSPFYVYPLNIYNNETRKKYESQLNLRRVMKKKT